MTVIAIGLQKRQCKRYKVFKVGILALWPQGLRKSYLLTELAGPRDLPALPRWRFFSPGNPEFGAYLQSSCKPVTKARWFPRQKEIPDVKSVTFYNEAREPKEERRVAAKTSIPFAINYYPPVDYPDRSSFSFLLAHHSAFPLIHNEETQCSVKFAACWQG